MKKIVPGIGNKAKRYRAPNESLIGLGKKIRKRKVVKRKRKNERKRNKPKIEQDN